MSFRSLPAAWVVPWLLACGAGGALAQPSATASDGAASAPAAPAYRSAFEGYRAWAEPTPTPWREANDTVGRIGGWRAYAREAQGQPLEAPATPAPASAPSPAAPPAHDHSMHGGHR